MELTVLPVAMPKQQGPRPDSGVARLVDAVLQLRQCENDDVVAALVVKLGIATGRHRDVLLAIHGVRGRRGVYPGAAVVRPQFLAVAGVKGADHAIAFTVEHKVAGSGQHAADKRLLGVNFPRHLAGVDVDRGQTAPLLLAGDYFEGTAQPQLAPWIFGGFEW